jgi:hypothetical protein
MDMDLSPTLCEIKPGVIMMYPKFFLGIVFEKIRYLGLEIFLDYDAIVICGPQLFCYTLERDGWISRDLSSEIQYFLNILPMVLFTGQSHKQIWIPISPVPHDEPSRISDQIFCFSNRNPILVRTEQRTVASR